MRLRQKSWTWVSFLGLPYIEQSPSKLFPSNHCNSDGIFSVHISMNLCVFNLMSSILESCSMQIVRTYVIHLLRTYVTILCNWLIF